MGTSVHTKQRAPLGEAILLAVARLVEDSQAEKSREPTHSDLDFQIGRADLTHVAPKVIEIDRSVVIRRANSLN